MCYSEESLSLLVLWFELECAQYAPPPAAEEKIPEAA